MSNSLFILDTNVFLEAYKRYYDFELVPSFWSALEKHASKGNIKSVDKVQNELAKGNKEDKLADWVKNSFSNAFVSTDNQKIIDSYGKIMRWAKNEDQYNSEAIADLADGENADPWVVALAKAKNGEVVTHEVSQPEAKGRVKIPEICDAFNINYLDTFAMMKNLNISLA